MELMSIKPTINVFEPFVGLKELANVNQAFMTNWLGKGPHVATLEKAWARHIGVDPLCVVSTTCATEGLFQIMRLAGIGSGSVVIMPTISFIGAAQAVLACGAKVVYCDVDPHSLNPTLEDIVKAYHDNGSKHVAAVCLLHYGGVIDEIDDIKAWCDEHEITLIEDAALAQATKYKNRALGTWGDFGVWSFDAMKMITCGDGGMVYCASRDDAITLRKSVYMALQNVSGLNTISDSWWAFEVDQALPGARRAIMNDIAAGIGLAQLERVEESVTNRFAIIEHYNNKLEGLFDWPHNSVAYSFYWIQTPHRDNLARYLRSQNIYTTFRYWPLHWVFKTNQSLPGAEYAARNTLLLPLHNGLSVYDANQVCLAIKEFFANHI